jgi:CheY-like chemotaxis protein
VAHVDLAHDGVEALERLNESLVSPDLAIIDLKMPRMDGFRLLIEMACGGHNNFPIVVLTSSTAKNDTVRSLFRGARRVISKPNSLDELKRELAVAIDAI